MVLFPAPFGPIIPRDSPRLTSKGDILQGPEVALVLLTEFLLPKHLSRQSGQKIPQGVVDLTLAKLLVYVLHAERDVRHQRSFQMLSAKAGSRCLKKTYPPKLDTSAKLSA